MPLNSWKLTAALMLSLGAFAAGAQAQMPEGLAIPNSSLTPNAMNTMVRLAYSSSNYYRYHGDYNLTYNVDHIGSFVPYLFADVDIEATYNAEKQFHPDRLLGNFELGGKCPVGKGEQIVPYFRHMSSHNIDRTDRPRDAYELIGLRGVLNRKMFDLTLSLGTYTHAENAFFKDDEDLQGVYRLGYWGKHAVELDGDLRHVDERGGPRSGYTDYWIEPNLALSQNVNLYVGAGSVHDIDQANGTSDHPVIIGFKFKS